MYTYLGIVTGVGKKSGKVKTIRRHVDSDTFGGALKAIREYSRNNFELGAVIQSVTNIDAPDPVLA